MADILFRRPPSEPEILKCYANLDNFSGSDEGLWAERHLALTNNNINLQKYINDNNCVDISTQIK